MKGIKVLDSWALLAYLEGEPAGARITDLFKEATRKKHELFFSVINWGEVLYVVESRYGAAKRKEIERVMSQMPLEIIEADADLTRRAACLKAVHRLPCADCFAAALAQSRKGELVTGDKDFKMVETVIKILWLC